jgi:methylenetetrahydrofolate reductase (NADPH)
VKHEGLRISFELFPPKTSEGQQHLHQTALTLSAHKPDFFSITCGAGGTEQQGTLAALQLVQQATNSAVAPHVTCVGSTKEELAKLLSCYQQHKVRRLVALRGDLPAHASFLGDFSYAHELIQFVRETTGDAFHIETSAYPEFHPQAVCALTDMQNLKKKLAVGANSAITQYFFNPDSYFYFLDHCAKLGIYAPIIPGIMPITNFAKLVRFSAVCGAEVPRWIAKRLEAFGDDQSSLQAFGLEVVYDLCERLINGGAPGLHFYTLNQADASIKLLKLLGIAQTAVTC